MKLFDLLFSSEGRIPRSVWWQASLALFAVELTVTAAIQPEYRAMADDVLVQPNLPATLFTLAMLIPNYIITVKRLNDRDRPKAIAIIMVATVALVTVVDNFSLWPEPTPDRLWQGVIAGLLGLLLYLIYECGLWRGTIGPNRHGPDPLAPTPMPNAT